MSTSTQWSDLAPRVIWGLAMLLVGAIAIYLGGWPFRLLLWVAGALMLWELGRMFGSSQPVLLGVLGVITLGLAEMLPGLFLTSTIVVPLFGAAILVAVGQITTDRARFAIYVAWILLGCYALLLLRLHGGLAWAMWVVFVVIASDVAGYFAGRTIGGPKFWPAISPKKTWSGTAAGWIGAAIIGIVFLTPTGAGWMLVPLSMVTAFAGQMGDIAQSALKRRKGVKDSSDLIPGHGGVFDRFDAMLGASVFIALLWVFGGVPGLT